MGSNYNTSNTNKKPIKPHPRPMTCPEPSLSEHIQGKASPGYRVERKKSFGTSLADELDPTTFYHQTGDEVSEDHDVPIELYQTGDVVCEDPLILTDQYQTGDVVSEDDDSLTGQHDETYMNLRRNYKATSPIRVKKQITCRKTIADELDPTTFNHQTGDEVSEDHDVPIELYQTRDVVFEDPLIRTNQYQTGDVVSEDDDSLTGQHVETDMNVRRKKKVASPIRVKKQVTRRKTIAGAGRNRESELRRSMRLRTTPVKYWEGERFLNGKIHKYGVSSTACEHQPINGDSRASNNLSPQYNEVEDMRLEGVASEQIGHVFEDLPLGNIIVVDVSWTNLILPRGSTKLKMKFLKIAKSLVNSMKQEMLSLKILSSLQISAKLEM